MSVAWMEESLSLVLHPISQTPVLLTMAWHSPCCCLWWAPHVPQLKAQRVLCSPPYNTEQSMGWGETWTGSALHCHPLKDSSATGPQRVGRVGKAAGQQFWSATADQLGYYTWGKGFSDGSDGKKNLPGMQETWVWSLDQEDPWEKGMATHSSILAWKILWSEEPGGLQSMGSQRVRPDWAHTHTLILGETHLFLLYFQELQNQI